MIKFPGTSEFEDSHLPSLPDIYTADSYWNLLSTTIELCTFFQLFLAVGGWVIPFERPWHHALKAHEDSREVPQPPWGQKSPTTTIPTFRPFEGGSVNGDTWGKMCRLSSEGFFAENFWWKNFLRIKYQDAGRQQKHQKHLRIGKMDYGFWKHR